MPYIPESRREVLRPPLRPENAETSGELNYQITVLLLRYLAHRGRSYQTMNDIAGACTGALAEFNRRVVAPYEDQKIAENGDLY